ncbi:MAG TPA: nitroreductase/quinone reductase family protein [Solirubrobacteraceae bacterium]|nr:nitroreductase/quinone reductase family protein [Solirubrobacteraceae bacterium]
MERERMVRWFQRRVANPFSRTMVRLGLQPTQAILETRGRRSGEPRAVPVGNGLDADGRTFWLVTEFGRRTHYVRNIEADPHVRVLVGRRWRTGVATLMPEDDARARQHSMGRLNAAVVRAVGTELLTVRIDLDP